jgi:hypothetical protein
MAVGDAIAAVTFKIMGRDLVARIVCARGLSFIR